MKGTCPDKLLLELAGKPVAAHAIDAYDRVDEIGLIVIVTRPELVPAYQGFKEKYSLNKEILVTVGGETRMDSVLNGVRAVPAEYDYVAIGDGARPLIRTEDIARTILAAQEKGAAALGVHLTDTVKEVDGGEIVQTLPRERLVGIQTPQVFGREEYLEIARKAAQSGNAFTDDASIYEFYGKPVAFVEGHRDNLKITAPEDIAVMRVMMEDRA
ncbi:MAG: 2-C-methyl-D-erythritol 4-phosphate cytidylyltransferase [Clostridia bacterium]|nr:2-C-methyl-D-erythritol 4-phosphate cytidylyltransferase [Clostridia bacterium]